MRASDGAAACAIVVIAVLIGQHVASLRRAPERGAEACRVDAAEAETAELESEPAAAAGPAGTRGAFERSRTRVDGWAPGARAAGPEIAETGNSVTWIP